MYLSPLMPKSCAGHYSHTVWDNLVIFGKDIYQVKKVFYPNKHTASSFIFTRHLFLLLLLNMYIHRFKVFANNVYPVQIITSEDDFDKNKKKINKRTHKNKIIHSSPFFVFTYYFGHISYYLCIFLLCSRSIYPWYRLKYTKFWNGGLVGGLAISPDGYFFLFWREHTPQHTMTHKGWCIIKQELSQTLFVESKNEN